MIALIILLVSIGGSLSYPAIDDDNSDELFVLTPLRGQRIRQNDIVVQPFKGDDNSIFAPVSRPRNDISKRRRIDKADVDEFPTII